MILNKDNINIRKLFSPEKTFAFTLLIVLLVFESFRPDRLVPGGRILSHFPTAILFILLFLWLKEPYRIVRNLQTKCLFAFVVLMAIQIPLSRNWNWAYHGFEHFVVFGLSIFLFKIQFINSQYKVVRYIKLFVILSIFFAILGTVGKGLVQIPLLEDENDFALFMNILIPFGYFLAQETKDKRKRIFYYSCVVLYVLGNVASFSRGGFVGLLGVGIFIFYKSKNKVTLVLIAALLVVLMFAFAPPEYWDEMSTIKEDSHSEVGTGKLRYDAWKAGWQMFLDHPIIGVGANNFGIWLQDYYPVKEIAHKMWGRAAHSLYFTLIPEMGIVGTVLFIGMLWGNYKDHCYISHLEARKGSLLASANLTEVEKGNISKGIRTLHFFSLAYSGAMVAYFVTGIFISVLWYGYFWILMSFYILTSNAARKIEGEILNNSKTTKLHLHDKFNQ